MKRSKITLVAALLAGSFLMSSCIGPFKVTQSMWKWNGSLGGKFVNEIVFLAFHIVPVYEVVYLADIFVFNTIDFWGGSSSFTSTKQFVKGEKDDFIVEGNQNGYHITNVTEDKALDLVFDKDSKTWNVEANGESAKLMTLVDDKNVVMYLNDGTSMNIELSQAGYMAFRQAINSQLLMAQK